MAALFPPPPPPPELYTLDVSLRPVGEGEGGEAGGEGTEEEEEEEDEDDEDEGKEEAEGAVVGWAAAPPRGGGLCISEEWLRFFADGEKRRREQNQRLQKAQEDWAARPLERKDLQRRAQQAACYGAEGAARIQTLEAQLNARFDHLKDTRRPVTWPAVPLRHVREGSGA